MDLDFKPPSSAETQNLVLNWREECCFLSGLIYHCTSWSAVGILPWCHPVPRAGLCHGSAGMEGRKRSAGYSYSTWSNWRAVSSHCSPGSCKVSSLCSLPSCLGNVLLSSPCNHRACVTSLLSLLLPEEQKCCAQQQDTVVSSGFSSDCPNFWLWGSISI